MINHVLPRMASSCAILLIALAHCGCQSMKSPSGWASAWTSKPRQSNPNDTETVTYLGQKKPKPKQPDMGELKERLASAGASRDGARQANYENYLRQGNQALVSNRLPEAKEAFEKALAIRPDDPDCHHRLAVVADKNQQFRLADEHYEAALKKRPSDPNLLSDMGYSYSLRQDDQRAEATLQQALAISPSHKGAMANLGAIYARQDRYEDAMAMFRRGAPEAAAQQYIAKLFPQRDGSSGFDPSALAQNPRQDNSRGNAPAGDQRPDFRNMTPEQLKEAMNRERDLSKYKRQQQLNEEIKPRREWYDNGQQMAQVPPASNSTPVFIGPGSNQGQPNATQNQFPVVTPNGGNPNHPGNPNGLANNGQFQGGNPGGQGFAPNGNGNNNQGGDSLNARPGTTPSIDQWNGAGIRDGNFQSAGGPPQNPSGRSPVMNVPYYPEQSQPGNPGSQPGQSPSFNNLNLQPSPGAIPGQLNSTDARANQAAAQLGMNVGPGGLFPVVPLEAMSQSGFGSQGPTPPAIETRYGAEFPSPPSYQNPGQFQPQPARNGFAPGDQRQGAVQRSPWGDFSSQPPGRGSFDSIDDSQQLGPQSPANGWTQNDYPVIQAGATSPANPSTPRFNDSSDHPSASRDATWADKPNLGNSAPFNGAWPQGAQSANAGGGNNVPNSIPMWNGGQQNSRPQPKQFGPAATNSSANSPEPWPYRPK